MFVGHQSVNCVLEAAGPGAKFQFGHWLWKSHLILINNLVLSHLTSNLGSLSERPSSKSGSNPGLCIDLACPTFVCDTSLETAGVHQSFKPGPASKRWATGEEEMDFQSVLPPALCTGGPKTAVITVTRHGAISFLVRKRKPSIQTEE